MSDSLQMQILARATATAMLKHKLALQAEARSKKAVAPPAAESTA